MENKTKKPTYVRSEEGIVIPEIANEADLIKAIARWPIASTTYNPVCVESPYDDDGDSLGQTLPKGMDVASMLTHSKLRLQPEERTFWGAVLQNQIDSWKK